MAPCYGASASRGSYHSLISLRYPQEPSNTLFTMADCKEDVSTVQDIEPDNHGGRKVVKRTLDPSIHLHNVVCIKSYIRNALQ